MQERLQLYIDGRWVDPIEGRAIDVIDPSTEQACARIALGGPKDVDVAVAAARAAFERYSQTSVDDRIALIERILAVYERRADELAETISREMGAPLWLARSTQVGTGRGHLQQILDVLRDFPFEVQQGSTMVRREPIGVCGFITPWNWPVNQIMCKVAPALGAGCSMVLKPAEIAPMNAVLLTEIFDEAGVPAGVVNLVHGDGPGVGQAIASHPGIDMVSFTGSTRAGVEVAHAAAPGVKRVTQELGGKSPNLILEDADLAAAVASGVTACMNNSGQTCAAPTRMLVPESRREEAVALARAAAEEVVVGAPGAEATRIGPLVSEAQWQKVQGLIQQGIDEGATLVTGGVGRPEGLEQGYYARPTVFADVRNDMTIAQEEIFGPVLAILTYRDEDEAIRIANDTEYGLAAVVHSTDLEHARRVAARIRAGRVGINGGAPDFGAPFGGYKQSGNGREWGRFGLEEFLETKSVLGWEPA